VGYPAIVVSLGFIEEQPQSYIARCATQEDENRGGLAGSEFKGLKPLFSGQILRLTTPELKNVRGPIRSE
jgi:hypothetical protein